MSKEKKETLLPKKENKEGRSRYRNDILLLSLVLAAAILGALLISFLREDGKTVTVSVDGELFGQYPLAEDKTVEIASGESGDNRNLLVISNGKAYVSDADCPNHDCVRVRAISSEGETIICVPNRVVISID